MTNFEFSNVQNGNFKGLAQKANLIAGALAILALYHISRVFLPEATPHIGSNATYVVSAIIPDIFGIIAAIFFVGAAKSYRAIVRTQGSDIPLLILGNDKLRQALNCLTVTMLLYSARFVLMGLIFKVVLES